ncbi:MAG: hypothetical protein CMF31_05070 [Kordiimonas sp.]|nr:hypothetical protein [Kordiimonas sp.]
MNTTEMTNPPCLPVTLQQAKSYLRVLDGEDDATIIDMIAVATRRAEVILNRPIIARQYRAEYDCFPAAFELKKSPVLSVDSITYIDTDGASQTLVSQNYRVDLGDRYRPARISPATGITWPATASDYNTVKVDFTAGYGADWTSVPAAVRHAVLMLTGHYYDERSIVTYGRAATTVPETAAALLAGEALPI